MYYWVQNGYGVEYWLSHSIMSPNVRYENDDEVHVQWEEH